MIKLSFKKWWWYLKPSFRRWLRECEQYVNSEEFEKKTQDAMQKSILGGIAMLNLNEDKL